MKRALLLLATLCWVAPASAQGQKKFVLMLAGRPSHGAGEHEHNAGIKLFKKCLDENAPQVEVKAYFSGEWPSADDFAKADTFVVYSDGGGGHPSVQQERLKQLDKEMNRGMGYVCIHYAVEVPKDKGGAEFLKWLGGYFETNWSVNPHWEAKITEIPKHPVSNGVKPFQSLDEWYYHMRFRPEMKGVTPILTDLPPDSTLKRPDGPHSGNPAVREAIKNKERQHIAWAVTREDGGRGFGFTGGHFHRGWANDNQRKLLLNAILWTAKAEVPADGVPSTVTADDMKANLDPKPTKKK
jgi:type 1 glutamine amidotransferase